MWHRPLSEMLSDVYCAVDATRTPDTTIHTTYIQLTLPVEIWLQEQAGELTFIADLPIWRWRTVFDQIPAQLSIRWEEVQP